MPSVSFSYDVEGLSYTITVIQDADGFRAEITVNSGQMDVNALYLGDADQSGASASLRGPLNMNGEGSQFEGEPVQWDQAITLSQPGLGRDGADKPTFLTEGETLSVDLDITSLDDVAFIGIRATSTSTPEGSIKAVTAPDSEEECDCECEVTYPGEAPEIPAETAYMQFYVDLDTGERLYYDVTLDGDGTPPSFDDYWNALLETDEVAELDCDWSLAKAIAWNADGIAVGVYNYLPPEEDAMPLPAAQSDPEEVAADDEAAEDLADMMV